MARLGQHFLRDRHVLDDVLSAADLHAGEAVLEVGPGRGVLTERLSSAVGASGRVVAVEVDPELVGGLQDRFGNVELWIADAARADLSLRGPYDAIVANLPYQISGPITIAFLDLLRGDGWSRAVLMVQKEFGQRLLAGPGSKAYGRISVQVARWCRAEKVRDVGPGSFDPPPRVDSMVVRLVPAEPLDVDERMWDLLLRAAFGQRRKKLANALTGLPMEREVVQEALRRHGFEDLRAEQLSVQDFAVLCRELAEGG